MIQCGNMRFRGKFAIIRLLNSYKLFRRGIQIEFLKPISIGEDLSKENDRLMDIVKNKLEENR